MFIWRRRAEGTNRVDVGAFRNRSAGISLGADDGTRTRDPHLGNVAGAGLRTCGDGPIPCQQGVFFLCNPIISRRFPVVDGTPTGPHFPPGPPSLVLASLHGHPLSNGAVSEKLGIPEVPGRLLAGIGINLSHASRMTS